MFVPKPPWWRTDDYHDEVPLGNLGDPGLWGPKGPGLIQLWDNGTTETGWGREMFMHSYNKNKLSELRILHGYKNKRWNFAFIMRSAKLVCIDIDGKNGGLEHATELGFLPPTAAETSKSGNGYHLFYEVDDTWDDKDGFAGYRDIIGLVTGVDFRAVGCVYHYPTQRWNDRLVEKLPQHLHQLLMQRQQRQTNAASIIAKTLELDTEEIMIMQAELIQELDKPIPEGKRNNTLFAIGSKLRAAQVVNWEDLIGDRAVQLGLDDDEIAKLTENIRRYAP